MKKLFFLGTCLSVSSSLFAVPIEQRDLSNANSGTAAVAQQSSQLWELHQQIQQLQAQVRELRGQLEEQNHQLDTLNSEVNNRYTDLDQRLELLNQKIDPESVEPDQNTDSTSNAENKDTTIDASTVSSTQEDEIAYNMAYEAYKKGGAAKAIVPMENFIQNFPNSSYVSHAYYWLGEFNLSLTPPNYNQAKDNFEIVAGNYPKSNKAPAALYRLSEIAKNIDYDIPKAKEYYLRLIQKYPESKEAETARSSINL